MGKIKIRTREKPDPSGHKVDLYSDVKLVRALVFDNTSESTLIDYLSRVIKVLLKIRESKNKRVRERDFPIWGGSYINTIEKNLISIALPDPTAYEVLKIFCSEFEHDENYLESSSTLLRDISGEPIARYFHGSIIVYVHPFNSSPVVQQLEQYQDSVEYRSWDKDTTKKSSSPYSPVPAPDYTSPRIHDLQGWRKNHGEILGFLGDLKGPCGYNRLRNITEKNFGIEVYEEFSPKFFKYGCIRTSWLQDDMSVGVRILVNKSLDAKLKYIVLAHELSHYCLHFPLLLIGQIIEEASWEIPEFEVYYRALLNKYSSDLFSKIEVDANQLASCTASRS